MLCGNVSSPRAPFCCHWPLNTSSWAWKQPQARVAGEVVLCPLDRNRLPHFCQSTECQVVSCALLRWLLKSHLLLWLACSLSLTHFSVRFRIFYFPIFISSLYMLDTKSCSVLNVPHTVSLSVTQLLPSLWSPPQDYSVQLFFVVCALGDLIKKSLTNQRT